MVDFLHQRHFFLARWSSKLRLQLHQSQKPLQGPAEDHQDLRPMGLSDWDLWAGHSYHPKRALEPEASATEVGVSENGASNNLTLPNDYVRKIMMHQQIQVFFLWISQEFQTNPSDKDGDRPGLSSWQWKSLEKPLIYINSYKYSKTQKDPKLKIRVCI